MATLTVARTMTMAGLLPTLILLMANLAGAQTVVASNDTLPTSMSKSETQLSISGPGFISFDVAPLTSHAGLGGNPTVVGSIKLAGPLKLATPQNQSGIAENVDMVLVTCDSSNSNLTPSDILSNVVKAAPMGIILYSTTSQECNTTGDWGFGSMYTMTSAADSVLIESQATKFPDMFTAKIQLTNTTFQSSSGTGNTSAGSPAPTTAVAMSILYSITGIITLLFLIIIATGAIRAHRHPERYGPRVGHLGRPRQSRAKGLARAMLETLPIVKFGDPEPAKPGQRDIELEDGTSTHTHEISASPEATGANGESSEKALEAIPGAAQVVSGMNANTQQSTENKSEVAPLQGDGELGCSICTEDFTTGEDVRVLPCKHKYHPACIDPWLLNVSGTCPLCRHDLRPAAETETTAEGDELPPPLTELDAAATTEEGAIAVGGAEAPQRRRASRFLDLHRLRTANADERIAALRRLREQSQQEGSGAAVEDTEELGRRARLTNRLRDTFRIRTRRQNETAPVEVTTPAQA